MAIGVKRI